MDDLPEYSNEGAAPWQLQSLSGALPFYMAGHDGQPILRGIKQVIKARHQLCHQVELDQGNYKATPWIGECDLSPRQWKVSIFSGPRKR